MLLADRWRIQGVLRLGARLVSRGSSLAQPQDGALRCGHLSGEALLALHDGLTLLRQRALQAHGRGVVLCTFCGQRDNCAAERVA